MTTLATLKAEIASDLDREDGSLATEIAAAITTAIGYYKPKRFYFNERRSLTFSTVASQQNYGSADNTAIPDLVRIDRVHKTVSGQRMTLRRVDFLDLEPLYDVSASTGEPYDFAYFNREIWLYPVPDQVYTIRVIGLYKVAGPATDGEADNPWMTEAYELIRYRAEAYLAANSLRNPELASAKLQAEADALSSLRAETTKRASLGTIQGSGL